MSQKMFLRFALVFIVIAFLSLALGAILYTNTLLDVSGQWIYWGSVAVVLAASFLVEELLYYKKKKVGKK